MVPSVLCNPWHPESAKMLVELIRLSRKCTKQQDLLRFIKHQGWRGTPNLYLSKNSFYRQLHIKNFLVLSWSRLYCMGLIYRFKSFPMVITLLKEFWTADKYPYFNLCWCYFQMQWSSLKMHSPAFYQSCLHILYNFKILW